MRLIDMKIKDENFIKALGGALRKKPSLIRQEMNRRKNNFDTQMDYIEAIEKIEGKIYTIQDLFLTKILTHNNEKWQEKDQDTHL